MNVSPGCGLVLGSVSVQASRAGVQTESGGGVYMESMVLQLDIEDAQVWRRFPIPSRHVQATLTGVVSVTMYLVPSGLVHTSPT